MLLFLQAHRREFQFLPKALLKQAKYIRPFDQTQFIKVLKVFSEDNADGLLLILPLEITFPDGSTQSARELIRALRFQKIWLPVLVMGHPALVTLLRQNPANLLLCSPGVHYLRYFTEVSRWELYLAQLSAEDYSEKDWLAYLSPNYFPDE
jgi:hypothetical protein